MREKETANGWLTPVPGAVIQPDLAGEAGFVLFSFGICVCVFSPSLVKKDLWPWRERERERGGWVEPFGLIYKKKEPRGQTEFSGLVSLLAGMHV